MSDLKARLQKSQEARAAMLKRFGFMPMSILKLSRGALHRRMFQYAGDRSLSANMKNNNKEKLAELAAAGYHKASPSERGAGRCALY